MTGKASVVRYLKTRVLALVLLSWASMAPAQVYKWVDEDGIVNYSNTAPPGDSDFSVLRFPCYASDPKCRSVAWEKVPLNTRSFEGEIRAAVMEVYERAGYAPPSPEQAVEAIGASAAEAEAVVRMLVRNGDLVRIRDDLIYRSDQLEKLVGELRSRHAAGDEFTVGDFKEWAGVTRKHAIPLLEYLDQHRITRRQGDKRVLL